MAEQRARSARRRRTEIVVWLLAVLIVTGAVGGLLGPGAMIVTSPLALLSGDYMGQRHG